MEQFYKTFFVKFTQTFLYILSQILRHLRLKKFYKIGPDRPSFR